jgi:hypothetical protein
MFSRPGMPWYSLPRKEQSNCLCQTTRDIVEEVYMKYVNGIVPLSMEWEIRTEVYSYFHDSWIGINGPASQPEPGPFIPECAGVAIRPDAISAFLQPLMNPVQELMMNKAEPDSQLTMPWELHRMEISQSQPVMLLAK